VKLTDNLFFYPEKGMPSSNTYVVKDDVCVLIDPGTEMYLPGLLQDMGRDGIKPEDIDIITNTHLHPDHCWGNQALKNISGARIAINSIQKQYYRQNVVELPKLFSAVIDLGSEPKEFKEDSLLDESLKTGNIEMELIHAPGHSPDSICFYCRDKKFLICGDVVFAQSTGRVDFPGGNAGVLKNSIEGLARLDIEYLLPGHMNILEGAEVIKKNFNFVRQYVFPWL